MARIANIMLATTLAIVTTSVAGCLFNPQPDPPADALSSGAGTNQGGGNQGTTGSGAMTGVGAMDENCGGPCGGNAAIGGAPPSGGGMGGTGGIGGAGGALGGAGGAGGAGGN
jgi:hypothetical protein